MNSQREMLDAIMTRSSASSVDDSDFQTFAIQFFDEYARHKKVEYSIIAELVFKAVESDIIKYSEILQENKETLLEVFETIDNSNNRWNRDKLEDNLAKIIRHYELCTVQKSYIEGSMITVKDSTKQKIKEEIDVLNSKIKKADENLKKVTSHFDEFKESKGNLYSDIISILGIFSSFLFLAFVGFDGLKEVGKAFALSNSIPIKNVVMIACVLLIFSSLMLYCLLFWVSRLTGRSLVNEKSKCRCVPNFIYRHWPMATYIVVIIAVFLYAFYRM